MEDVDVFFSAGEVSGDISASEVIEELVKLGVKCAGVGGPRMEKAGMLNITKTDESISSAVGFVESIRYVAPKLILLRRVANFLRKSRPKLVVLVDNQGFNLPLAKVCKAMGLRVIYYFPPMVSVWGEKTKYTVAKYCDRIICTFREDYEIYKGVSENTVFVGNPVVDRVQKNYSSRAKYLAYFSEDTRKILLLPGSRLQEIKSLFPPMLGAVRKMLSDNKLKTRREDLEFYTIVSHPAFTDRIRRFIENYQLEDIVKVFESKGDYALIDVCDLAISASGTTTLELAILGKPVIVVYKVSRVTFEIGKRLTKTRFISLPNILLKEEIYPELLQEKVTPEMISNLAWMYLDGKYTREIREKLRKIKNLYEPGAVNKVVEEIRRYLVHSQR